MTAHLPFPSFQLSTAGYFNADGFAHLAQLAGNVREMPGGADETQLQINAGGVIVPTGATHRLVPDGVATVDNLDFILATNHPEGRILFLRPATLGHEITLRHLQAGTNPIYLVDALPFTMKTRYHGIALRLRSGIWVELFRWYGDDFAAYRAFIGAGPATETAAGIVELATASETRQGVLDTRAITPKGWNDASGSNVRGTYWRLPGNRIIQMGAALASATDDLLVELPIEMASAGYFVQATPVTGSNVSGPPAVRLVHCYGRTTLSFLLSCWSVGGTRSAITVHWEVKGFEPPP